MAWVPGIDTSSTQLDIALVKDGAPACSFSRYLPGSHAEHISEAVSFLTHSNMVAAGEIGRAGLTVGPGSFTGLRIGIAFVKGFFLTRKTRILPVSSLEAAARAYAGPDGPMVVVYEARRGQVFSARFMLEKGLVRRLTQDTLEPAIDCARNCSNRETALIDTLGYRSSGLPEVFSKQASVRRIDINPVQRAMAAAMMAWEAAEDDVRWTDPIDLQPQYLQESAAELQKTAGSAASR
jgi:tRNA threonylcarbamoyladenosine biosynthesis protein TsaB